MKEIDSTPREFPPPENFHGWITHEQSNMIGKEFLFLYNLGGRNHKGVRGRERERGWGM